MQKDKFLNEYVKGKKALSSSVTIIRCPKQKFSYFQNKLEEDFVSLKGLIKYVDFQCDINTKTGGCKVTPESKKCCCHNCKNNIGYISFMFEKDILFYSRFFNYQTGFWREGKGCILPHHRRSIVCLTHHCNWDGDGYKHFSKGMDLIKNKLKSLREKIIDNAEKGVFNDNI